MIVRENIGFTRGQSEEEIKSVLFGFRVGQIIVQKDIIPRRPMNSVFAIEYIVDSQLPDISLTIMGLGYFHYLKYKGPNDPAEKFFEFSTGLSTTTADPKDFRAITNEEVELIKEAIKKKPEEFKDKQKWFDIRTGEVGKRILLKEDFQRGLSGREIKDKLVGFRPGQLFTYDVPYSDKKPYKEVYMFIQKAKGEDYNYEDGIPIISCYVGAFSHKGGKPNQFLIRHKKILGTVPLWQEEKRGLTEEEMVKVRKTFKEMPEYFQKIKNDVGILPSLQ